MLLGAVVLSAFPFPALPLVWPVPLLPSAVTSANVLLVTPLWVQEHDSDVTSGQAHHWKLKPLGKGLCGDRAVSQATVTPKHVPAEEIAFAK